MSRHPLDWGSFYNIPVVHYSPKVVENLPPRALSRWRHCLAAFQELETSGITVILVPLSCDHSTGSYWMDYVDDYVEHTVPGALNRPQLNVVLKIDDDGHLTELTIHIHHSGIERTLKTRLKQILGRFPWFVWNGRQSRTMELHLDADHSPL